MSDREHRVAGTRFTREWLNGLARVADEPADDVIGALTDAMDATQAREEAFPELTREIWRDIDDLKPKVREFLCAGAELDDDLVDAERVRRAQGYFEEHGVAVITALFHAALPEAYLGHRGVQVLDLTGGLVNDWARRIRDTGQFLLNVLSPRVVADPEKTSLSAGQPGAIAVRRVRLTHAAVRWLLDAPRAERFALLKLGDLGTPTIWEARMVDIGEEEEDQEGKHVVTSRPLNQQDLLATLGTFTTVTFDALAKFAVRCDDDDKDAYQHLWNVVGWHLGIGDAAAPVPDPPRPAPDPWPGNNVLPLGVGEMDQLYRWLSTDLQHECSQGWRLAKTLVQELSHPLPRPLDGMPAVVVRYLIGDDKADKLQIERGGYTELLTMRTGLLEQLVQRGTRVPAGQKAMAFAGQMLTRYALRAFVNQSRDTGRGLRIDPIIAAEWGVQIGPEARVVPRG